MACKVALNGKSRLSVCNALDKILIHKDLKSRIPELVELFETNNIEVITSEFNEELLKEEFLSAKIYIQLVDSCDQAINLINNYSGGHSASIITNDTNLACTFQNQVDCAAVYHNASVRFTDGFEFGYGAEMAVGTRKLHARGPIGVNQLVTNKWYIYGNGQIR
jgi:glutamate-5-semialdehyde dehydrogenase